MTDTIQIPLKKLFAAPENVRKTGAGDGLEDLIASIGGHGLLQSLVVRKAKRGKYAVIAGQRRLMALNALAASGRIDAGTTVPCTVLNGEAGALEISLAENLIRAPMHPADQFEAFREIIAQGGTTADIAARFNLSDTSVERRLRLGRLSPRILEAYRANEIGLEEAQAFALSDDHAEQERVLYELPEYSRSARQIKLALTREEVPVTDKRVRFVGIDAYEAAGGAVRRDLFDAAESGYLQDPVLLDRLVAEKLSAIAKPIQSEGWKWIDIVPDADYATLSAFKRCHPVREPLSPEAQAELDELTERYDSLAEQVESDDSESSFQAELEQIDARIDELTASVDTWPQDTLQCAGVIVTLDYRGCVDIRRGLIRPEDARSLAKASSEATSGTPALPASLVRELTAHRTAALRAVLASRPDIALAAIVHGLALKLIYSFGPEESVLSLQASSPGLAGWIANPEACAGLSAFDTTEASWRECLPQSPSDLWQWCLGQSQETLLALLAFLAASTIDAVASEPGHPRHGHADSLAAALNLNMSDWYRPQAETFFARLPRRAIIAAMEDASGVPQAPSLAKLKRSDLAHRAERAIADSKWLPEILRGKDQASLPGDTE